MADLTYIPTGEGWLYLALVLDLFSRKMLAARGITVSISRRGDCRDNAPMESANGTVKVECVHGENFETRAEAARVLVEYLGYYAGAL